MRLFGDKIQPRTIVTHYPAQAGTDTRSLGLERLRNLETAAAESLAANTRQAAMVRNE